MARRTSKRDDKETLEECRDWLKKAVSRSPSPLLENFFPKILEEAQVAGFSHDMLLNVVDEWLSYGYCKIIDSISNDIAITESGMKFFYHQY